MKQRYIHYDACAKPCTLVNVQTTLVSKESSESSNPRLVFMFGKTVGVSKEILGHTSLKLVAELGGYLGLTLGLSLVHLELPLRLLWNQFVARKKI